MTIGSASKLFWGGVRIGWIRANEPRIHGLVELRKAVDLASSVVDQLLDDKPDAQPDRVKQELADNNVLIEEYGGGGSRVVDAETARHVRSAMVEVQRRAGAAGDWVVEGRDIGTVVFPSAELKVFLTASAAERARRHVGGGHTVAVVVIANNAALIVVGGAGGSLITRPEIMKAIPFYEKAIELDPNYALAYVGLADAYRTLGLAGEMAFWVFLSLLPLAAVVIVLSLVNIKGIRAGAATQTAAAARSSSTR